LTDSAKILYKVIEVSPVSEETLEGQLNERTGEGWSFESVHFVMREGSHRPAMAYLFFTRGFTPGEGRSAQTAAPLRSVPET
jgi:hypothetical protein